MVEISISNKLREKLSDLVLGIIYADVKIAEHNPELMNEMKFISETIKSDLSEVSNNPSIRDARKAYKICGKDPARYRLSSEALRRRVKKEKELPQINNVVDIINLVSIKSGMSIGGYDAEKIVDWVMMDIGLKTDVYYAIGRGEFNIENLPVLRDRISAFGSPTSDSDRTGITLNTRKLLMVIFGFCGEQNIHKSMDLSVNLLKKYAMSKEIETVLIK
jgi:DNA/RNA-binding domain of Phe-tRNA-synthetase-like protein